MQIYKRRYFHLVQSVLRNAQGLRGKIKTKKKFLASQTKKLAKALSKCCIDSKGNAL